MEERAVESMTWNSHPPREKLPLLSCSINLPMSPAAGLGGVRVSGRWVG